MSRTIIVILILACLTASAEDLFFGEDKAKHFLTSACLTGMLSYAAWRNHNSPVDNPLLFGCSISIGMGVLKEIRDARRHDNHFCFKDLFWDAAGTAAGAFNMRMLPTR
jgi:uncharacterized protein YfiM (DUF2279 family)